MREYAKVSPQFWTGDTGREIRVAGRDALLVACYLMTCPSANAIGLYYLPIPTLSHETGIGYGEVGEAMRVLDRVDFARYDLPSEHVWVLEMARHQIAPSLKADDKMSVWIQKEVRRLWKVPHAAAFYFKYRNAYCIGTVELDALFRFDPARPSEGPSKALRSQEIDQEQETEQEGGAPDKPALPARLEELPRILAPLPGESTSAPQPVGATPEAATPVGDDRRLKPVGAEPVEAKAKRRTRIPNDFTLTEKMRAGAVERGVASAAVDEVFAHFREHHEARGSVMAEWGKAWLTWCRKEQSFAPRTGRKTLAPAPPVSAGRTVPDANASKRLIAEMAAAAGRDKP